MASERALISSLLKDREAYESVAPHITDKDVTEHAKVILQHIKEYYERDAEATHVDTELLVRSICRALPNPKHQTMFAEMVKELAAEDTSPANVVADFIAVRRQAIGHKLATLLASNKPAEDILPVLEEYEQWSEADKLEEKTTEVLQGLSVVELAQKRMTTGALIKVLPNALNEKLDGGLLRGHHMIVFARPETGKTLFAVNAIFGFLQQNLKVLYVGNEDPLDDIVLRVISRLTGKTKHEVLDDPLAADTAARERGYDNLILAGLAPGSLREIEELAEEYKPDVILVDQLRNLSIGKEENFTRKLEIAAAGVRAIGQRHKAAVISFTQAGDSASGKSVLDMGDVDSSNTGIPAQADVMVGIGMTEDDEAIGRRVLSLPKNKVGGMHAAFPVFVEPATSRMRSD